MLHDGQYTTLTPNYAMERGDLRPIRARFMIARSEAIMEPVDLAVVRSLCLIDDGGGGDGEGGGDTRECAEENGEGGEEVHFGCSRRYCLGWWW